MSEDKRKIELTITSDWVITDTDIILVKENYMEEVLRKEGYSDIDDEDGVDSTLVCDYAICGLGFKNLGDYGQGFIFECCMNDMNESMKEKYFTK